MENKNILYYYKLGEVLDQTQAKISPRRYTEHVVFTNIWREIVDIDKFSQKYGLTLTFKSQFAMDDPKELHRFVHDKISKSCVFKNTKYIFFPEFTQNGNLHYHGVIWDCYEVDFIRISKWWKRSFGYTREEKEFNMYICCNKAMYCERRKMFNKWCWSHYMSKDHGKVGLYPFTNY